jgi:threonine dehydratase
VIAGQGTVALEMLTDVRDLDTVIVPVGGGGLISGIAVAAKAINPAIEILGVQASLYPSMRQAIRGEAMNAGGDTIAEGIAVKRPGALTEAICRKYVADILTADETTLEHAVQLLAERQKVVAEGAGAAGIAALMAEPRRFRNRRVGVVVSGGNIDARLLASVLMRGLVADGRMARLRVEISDAPGKLAAIAQLIAEAGGNIVEIYHQRLFQDVPVKLAELDVVVETRNAEHVRDIARRLAQAGHAPRLLGTTKGAGEVL